MLVRALVRRKVANYGSGSVASVRIDTNRSTRGATLNGIDCNRGSAVFNQTGMCPVTSVVQLGGNPHSAYATPDNRCVLSPNIAQNRIYGIKFDPSSGNLDYRNGSFVQAPNGAGPRHLTFSPSDPSIVFVLNEPSCTITTWRLGSEGSCVLSPIGVNHTTIRSPN